MRILITGSSGLLASRLLPYLKAHGHEAIPFKRNAHPCIYSKKTWKSILKESKPEAIINLAAITNVDWCEENLKTAFDTHFSIPYHISSAISECDKKPFLLHISTDQVYSGKGLHTEEMTAPINRYGLTKLMGEKPVIEANGAVLRTNFFGRSLTKSRDSITDWIYKTVKSQASIKGFTDVHFSPIGIDSLCQTINEVIQQQPNDVYNLGACPGVSKAEFIDIFCKQFPELKPNIILDEIANSNLSAPRPHDMRMDCRKIASALSIKSYGLEEEIIRESKYYK